MIHCKDFKLPSLSPPVNSQGGSFTPRAMRTTVTLTTPKTPRNGASTSRRVSQAASPSPFGTRRSSMSRAPTSPRDNQKRKKRPSFHLMKLVDEMNAPTNSLSPMQRSLSPQQDLNVTTSLRSQLHQLDSTMLRTFDSKTGQVTVNHASTVPKRANLVRRHYLAYWRNPKKVAESEELVRRLPFKTRKKYAIESVKRKHQEELQRIIAKDVFDQEVALHRVNVSLQMSLEHIVGQLDSETRELSMIRMESAATDAVLYKEAERVADAEIQHFHAKVIPAGTTAVQLMSMAIDSYKERFVPAPPRQLVPETASPVPMKPTSRLSRRPSAMMGGGLTSFMPPPAPSLQHAMTQPNFSTPQSKSLSKSPAQKSLGRKRYSVVMLDDPLNERKMVVPDLPIQGTGTGSSSRRSSLGTSISIGSEASIVVTDSDGNSPPLPLASVG